MSEAKTPTVNEISFDVAKWERQCLETAPYVQKLSVLFQHFVEKYAIDKKIANPNNMASILYQLAGKAAIEAQTADEPAPEAPTPIKPTPTPSNGKLVRGRRKS